MPEAIFTFIFEIKNVNEIFNIFKKSAYIIYFFFTIHTIDNLF